MMQIVDHRLEVESDDLDADLAGVDLREIENIVEQAQQHAGAALEQADMLHRLVGQIRAAQHLDHAENARERRAQLVAHRRQEARFGAIGGLSRLLLGSQLARERGQLLIGIAQRRDAAAALQHIGDRPGDQGQDQRAGDEHQPEGHLRPVAHRLQVGHRREIDQAQARIADRPRRHQRRRAVAQQMHQRHGGQRAVGADIEHRQGRLPITVLQEIGAQPGRRGIRQKVPKSGLDGGGHHHPVFVDQESRVAAGQVEQVAHVALDHHPAEKLAVAEDRRREIDAWRVGGRAEGELPAAAAILDRGVILPRLEVGADHALVGLVIAGGDAQTIGVEQIEDVDLELVGQLAQPLIRFLQRGTTRLRVLASGQRRAQHQIPGQRLGHVGQAAHLVLHVAGEIGRDLVRAVAGAQHEILHVARGQPMDQRAGQEIPAAQHRQQAGQAEKRRQAPQSGAGFLGRLVAVGGRRRHEGAIPAAARS